MASALGVVFLVLALVGVLVNYQNIDLLGGVVVRLLVGGVLLVPAAFFIEFGLGIRKRWVPVWGFGWICALSGVLQLPYSVYLLGQAGTNDERVAAFVWALVAPVELAVGLRLIKLARRGSARPPRLDPAGISRAPVLYLRPFSVDQKTAQLRARQDATSLALNTRTEEEQMVEVFDDFGPCVAIGRPGERLPQLGFQRLYVDDDRWQATVIDLLEKASLVVLSGGVSRGLHWEMEEAVKLVPPERLLVLIPTGQKQTAEVIDRVTSLVPKPPPPIPKTAIFHGSRTFSAILYFSSDWTPHWAVPRAPSHLRRSFVPGIAPTLRNALKPVYAQLGLKWTGPRINYWRVAYESGVAVTAVFFGSILLSSRG